MKTRILISLFVALPGLLLSQTPLIQNGIGNLYQLSNAKSRSVSPENLTGGKGQGGMTTLEKGSAAMLPASWARGGK